MKRLSERIEFVRAKTIPDDTGGFSKTVYETLYTCWANVSMSSNSREFQNMQLANMVLVDVTIRYSFTFAPSLGMSIKWRDKLLTIHGSIDLTKKDFVKFSAAYDPAETITENPDLS